MKVSITVYLVKDSFGHEASVITRTESPNVLTYGYMHVVDTMCNENNTLLYFDGEPRHLKRWAEENKLKYREYVLEKELEID